MQDEPTLQVWRSGHDEREARRTMVHWHCHWLTEPSAAAHDINKKKKKENKEIDLRQVGEETQLRLGGCDATGARRQAY